MKLVSHKHIPTFLILSWLLVQLLLFTLVGVVTNQEAVKYIHEARLLLATGSFSENKYFFYLPTILLIAACIKTGIGYTGAVIIQIGLNGLATIGFYRIVLRVSHGSLSMASLSTFLLISYYPFQMWNVYLFTESLFFSFIIGFTWLLVFRPQLTLINSLLWTAALFAVSITRPFGLLFVPAFLVYLHLTFPVKYKALSILTMIVGGFAFYYFLNYVFSSGREMNAMKPFIEEHIICLMPTGNQHHQLMLSDSHYPVNQLLYYIFHNPAHFLNLSARRLVAFYGLYRPYFSVLHNVYLVSIALFIYAFSLYGLKRFAAFATQAFKGFVFSVILIFTIAITFQCDDYHNRFIMPIFPYFLILSAFGIDKLVGIIQRNRSKEKFSTR